MGNNEIDEDVMPVFLINGFLEAGKTQFLEFTMDQEYFQTEGKTLLIVCEEGDTEYDEKKLKKHQTPGACALRVERYVEPGRAETAG